MKQFMKRWIYNFSYVSIAFIFVTAILRYRFNTTYTYNRIVIGAIIISLFLALSISVFKRKGGNEILNAIFGFILLLPDVVIIKRLFNYQIFKYSFIIYLFAVLCAIIYGIAVYVVSNRVKNEANELNEMLKKHDEK